MLKVGGIWVSPVEVENTLVGHPAVLEAAVVGAEDTDRLVKPKAFVVLREGPRRGDLDALRRDLQEHVKARLSKHKYPRWVVFVDDLPKNDRGKVDKKVLLENEKAGINPWS